MKENKSWIAIFQFKNLILEKKEMVENEKVNNSIIKQGNKCILK